MLPQIDTASTARAEADDRPAPPDLDARRHALFLDFDGTLVGFVDDPDAVKVAPDLVPALERLSEALGGALAIVTGRPVAAIDRFLSPLSLATAGVHGFERRHAPGAPVERSEPPSSLEDARRVLLSEADGVGLRVEDKGTAIVLHYRGREHLAEEARALGRKAVGDADDLKAIDGHAIVELRPTGIDKGRAIEALMGEGPFAGRAPVFLGDDTTDEDGFAAAQAMGGFGIKVGAGRTAAHHRVETLEEVRTWLLRQAERLCAAVTRPG